MSVNLNFRQLLTFKTVMQAGSISEAARQLGRTQSAVSATIAGLEEELRFPLFERRKGRLVPKPEAQYFLEEAEAVLERLSRSTRTMGEIGNLSRGVLRIASMPAAASFLVPGVLAGFLRDKPEVTASMMLRSSVVVEEWIASQQYDVGVAETPEARASIAMRVHEMACVCALPADDPLAAKEAVGPRDLDGRAMAALYPDHRTNVLTREAFAASGSKFRQSFEFQTFLPALELVRRGLCGLVCDPISAASYAENVREAGAVVFRRFEPAVPYSVAILTPAHRPPSALAESFVETLDRALARFDFP